MINSPEMIGYSGNVELLSAYDGTLLFKGKMDDGRINGKGRLYTYEGALLYEGNFEMESYSGEESCTIKIPDSFVIREHF